MPNKISDSNQSTQKNIRVSETLVLAIVPFIAYAIVFSYQLGYLSVFRLPFEFIFFDLTSVFLVLTSILIVFTSAYVAASPLLLLISNRPKPIRFRLYILFTYTVFFAIYFLLYFGIRNVFGNFWIFGTISLAFGVIPFLWPLYTQRHIKGYLAKLEAEDERIKKSKNTPFLDAVISVLGIQLFIALSIAVMMVLISLDTGRSAALQQSDYMIVNTSPERVVLWYVDDQAIGALFDRNNKEIETNFVFLKLGENSALEFHLENIGPLKMKASPVSSAVTNKPEASSNTIMETKMNIDWTKVIEYAIIGGITLFVSFATVYFTDWFRTIKDRKREGILYELAVLRGKGVELRNEGEKKPLAGKQLSNWIARAIEIENDMVAKASEISKVEGERLDYLDRVQGLAYPHIRDPKQISALQNLSGMLIRADALLNKYRF